MTALLPTRWISSLSTNLIHLQVDAEVRQVAREGEKNQDSEEEETEVVKSPKNLLSVEGPFQRHHVLLTLYQKSLFQV